MTGWVRLGIVAMVGALAYVAWEAYGAILLVGLENTFFEPWWAPWLVAAIVGAVVVAWVALGFIVPRRKNKK